MHTKIEGQDMIYPEITEQQKQDLILAIKKGQEIDYWDVDKQETRKIHPACLSAKPDEEKPVAAPKIGEIWKNRCDSEIRSMVTGITPVSVKHGWEEHVISLKDFLQYWEPANDHS